MNSDANCFRPCTGQHEAARPNRARIALYVELTRQLIPLILLIRRVRAERTKRCGEAPVSTPRPSSRSKNASSRARCSADRNEPIAPSSMRLPDLLPTKYPIVFPTIAPTIATTMTAASRLDAQTREHFENHRDSPRENEPDEH